MYVFVRFVILVPTGDRCEQRGSRRIGLGQPVTGHEGNSFLDGHDSIDGLAGPVAGEWCPKLVGVRHGGQSAACAPVVVPGCMHDGEG